jgi:hypothetical protein
MDTSISFEKMENEMWIAFSNGDANKFRNIVSDEALMICGGSKKTGIEYSSIVRQIKLEKYEISNFYTKVIDQNNVITNYIVSVYSSDQSIAGKYRVSSLWNQENGKWKVVFNQDSSIG